VRIRTEFKEVDVKANDVLTLDFVDGGTKVAVNGETQGIIAGAAFNRALSRIWLGDKPAHRKLKAAMRGG
jgi:long-chain acyl-CoA synthetase